MGCYCSKEDEFPNRLHRQDAYCYPSIVPASTYNCDNAAFNRQTHQQNFYRPHQQPKETADPKPKIGEYKCGACGRFWISRYCWPDKYQNCKRCKTPVYAHVHRELKTSDDVKHSDEKIPHEMELCQMCQQLGRACTTKSTKHNNKRRP